MKLPIRRTTALTVLLAAFLAGLALAYNDRAQHVAVYAAGGLCMLVPMIRRRVTTIVLLAVAAGIVLGVWRGAIFAHGLQPYKRLYSQKVILQVSAREDSVYGTNGQLTFEADTIQVQKPLEAQLPGRVKISGFGEKMVYKGDVVRVEGKLRDAKGGRQGQISYGQITVLERNSSAIDTIRRNFAVGMLNALPEPAASFGLGLLIGQRSTLPQDITTALAAVGLTHIVAVSGYNLTILVNIVRRLFQKRSKYQTIASAAILICLFLLVTGLSASIVRAAIVSGLSLGAWYYGRAIRPLLLITLAAALTAGIQPLYIWGDIGWYLSFLAFFGVLVLAPLITKRYWRRREPGFLAAILIETICAQILTLPLILYIFQQISVVSILSNVLVVPFIPYMMLLSLLAGLSGMFIPMVSGWVSWPAAMLLTYSLDIARWLAGWSHAVLAASINAWGLAVLYLLVAGITYVLWWSVRRGIITERKKLLYQRGANQTYVGSF